MDFSTLPTSSGRVWVCVYFPLTYLTLMLRGGVHASTECPGLHGYQSFTLEAPLLQFLSMRSW